MSVAGKNGIKVVRCYAQAGSSASEVIFTIAIKQILR